MAEAFIMVGIDAPSAGQSISPGRIVSGSGWVLSDEAVTQVDVYFGEHFVCAATLGEPPTDVSERFPHFTGQSAVGFAFELQLHPATPPAPSAWFFIEAVSAGGTRQRKGIPVTILGHARPGSTPPLETPALGGESQIWFEIDTPAVAAGVAIEPISSVLTVTGWAVARAGLATVEVFLDDRSLGLAYYGIRREDIAAMLPNIGGALLCGFALTAPRHLLGRGQRDIRVQCRTASGTLAEHRFTIVAGDYQDTVPAANLCRRVDRSPAGLLPAAALRSSVTVLIRSAGAGLEARAKLDATLASLEVQAYESWSAVVLPGPGETPMALTDYIATRRSRPGRIIAAERPDPQPSDFVAMLCAGDLLGVDALLHLALQAAREPAVGFWYADDRRAGSPAVPFFKPDWSPDLLMATNYIGRAWFASPAAIAAAGLTLQTLAAASDYALALRLSLSAPKTGHIPRILFDTSATRRDTDDDEREALAAAFRPKENSIGIVPGKAPHTWRIDRTTPMRDLVSIIIPTCAAQDLVKDCVYAIRTNTAHAEIEIIIVSNIPESSVECKEWLRARTDFVIDVKGDFNWSRFNNIGARKAKGTFLLFLNDDTVVTDPSWLTTLLQEAARPEIGIVGPQLVYPDGKVQHAGMFLAGGHARHAFRFAAADDPGYAGLALTQRNVMAVTGACMMTRRAVYESVGGFDEAHQVVNNDLDYCLRVQAAGLRVLYTPFAQLIHRELASRATLADIYDRDRFDARWGEVLRKGDPYFNPNLAIESDDYAISTEPVESIYPASRALAGAHPTEILAVKLDHIGDFILAFPAFRRLKLRFPAARLVVLAAPASVALAHLEPAIDEVIPFAFFHAQSGLGVRSVDAVELATLKEQLTARYFSIAIDLRVHPDTRALLRQTGALLLAGYDKAGQFPWLDVSLEWEDDVRLAAKRAHVTDRLLELVEAVAVACEPHKVQPKTMDRAADLEALRAVPAVAGLPTGFLAKRLVCVHPAVGNAVRQWPPAYFAALIDMLIAEEGVHVVLVGAEGDTAIADEVLSHIKHRGQVVSLVGQLSAEHLPLLLRVADLFAGNNSGPQHLAATLGTPTVGIHSGVVDAQEWGPLGPAAMAIRRKTVCSPCYIATVDDCHRAMACLRMLRPSDVFRACQSMLALRPPRDQAPVKRRRRG